MLRSSAEHHAERALANSVTSASRTAQTMRSEPRPAVEHASPKKQLPHTERGGMCLQSSLAGSADCLIGARQ